MTFGCQTMVAALRKVVVKRPEEAFRSGNAIAKEWKHLGYVRPPDYERACSEHAAFVARLTAAGAAVFYLPADERTGLDSIYTHDPALITEAGAVIFQTGKPDRRGEGPAYNDALHGLDLPVLAVIDGEATAEAGDMIWLNRNTLLAGRGFRTNGAGMEALSRLLEPFGVRVVPVELPYWNGPEEVLHLMSFVSLLDDDLAVVYRRLLPVPLYELFKAHRVQLVDVPDEEYRTLGCNVLALSPRNVLMVRGNPITKQRLEKAGCTVSEFEGYEICVPGAGGPTCLTRPLLRG